jgi:hypothetical protein
VSFRDDDGYEPGFELEPERRALLERAVEVVQADVRATGLPGTVRLVFPDWTYNAFIETWDGETSATSGISASDCGDPVAALVAAADDAQDALMHTLWGAWPVCPAHEQGLHALEHDGTAVWWCGGGGGHVVAPVGRLG